MNQDYINFKRERDLGEIISDTFKFLRENYRFLFKMIFKVAGPVFLVLVLALSYYSYIGGENLGNPFMIDDLGENQDLFFLSFFILMGTLMAFYIFLYGVVLHFIRSYIENKGQVIEEEVYAGMRNDFGGLLGLLLLVAIMTFFGLLMCVLPGIYLWAPLSLAPALLVFGRHSISDAITGSFSLIRDHWWVTFFALLVMLLLVYVITLIFQMPLYIYYFFKAMTMVQEGSMGDPSDLFDWVYVVFNVIASLAQYLLSTILIIATAFIYYNLDEKKNLTGSYETIANLGSQENN